MDELFKEIVDVYEREVFNVGELYDIIIKCGYSSVEARKMVRNGINAKEIGRVKYCKVRQNMPSKGSFVVLKKNHSE